MPSDKKQCNITAVTTDCPNQPKASEAMVIPNCVAARYPSRLCSIPRVVLAKRLPVLALISICEPRTLTMANSAATKKPFNITRKMVRKR